MKPIQCSRAFTLVELLVVITVVGVLVAMLLPALAQSRHQAQRVLCAANQRQFVAAAMTYANDEKGYWPSGVRDDGHAQATWISTRMFNRISALLNYQLGKARRLACPTDPWLDGLGYQAGYGHFIGYAYLGGQPTPFPAPGFWPRALTDWTSPQRTNQPGDSPLLVDVLGSSLRYGTWAAHVRQGGMRNAVPFADPLTLGAVGGNVAYVDGRVAWKPCAQQLEHIFYTNPSDPITQYW